MKKWIAFTIFSLATLSADYHEPSVTLNMDGKAPYTVPKFNLSLQHQSTIELEDGNIIILHGLSDPYSHKVFHLELGVGYRKIYEDFGFGGNFVYANENSWGFYNHHLVPGIEVFYKHFALFYNRYLPVKTGVEFKDIKYLFHDVSEIALSYRPSKKYEFCFNPYFNHQTKRFGFGGVISAYLFDDWKLSLKPYCEPKVQHGISFSLGYHFGGPKKMENRELKKATRFFYTSNKEEVERFTPKPHRVLIYAPEPLIVPAPIYMDKPISVEDKIEPAKPVEVKNWWDYLFFWRT